MIHYVYVILSKTKYYLNVRQTLGKEGKKLEAVIVGIKKSEFEGKEGKVKSTKYFVNFAGQNTEGFETGSVSWNEIKNGPPPKHAIGEIIEIEKAGQNYFTFPAPKLKDKFRINIEKV